MENIQVIKTKDGEDCILVKKSDKFIPLGSKYNFKNDVDRLLKELENINIKTSIIIIGLYNGEYLKYIDKYLTETNKVCILEFNKEIYNKFKDKVDSNKKIIYVDSVNNLNDFIKEYINNTDNFKIIEFGNYKKLYSEYLKNIYEIIRNVTLDFIIQKNTIKLFSEQWFNCFLNNLPKILKADYISRYKNIYKGYPAIIVSAGPSLEKNIKLLKELQNKVVIISNGRTLKSLLKYEINPNYVCVLDPGEGSYNVIKDNLNCKIPLVVNELSNYKVINEYKGDKIFESSINIKQLSKEILDIKDSISLYQGGSVAHMSTDLAKVFGCNPIIFIGQDLAYTNKKKHADIAVNKNFLNENYSDEYDLMVEGINGDLVETSYALNSFRLSFEQYIEYNNNITFINATEDGANIKGTLIDNLENIVKKYKEIDDIPKVNFKEYFSYIDRSLLKNKLFKYLEELKKIKNISNEVLKCNHIFLTSYINKQEINYTIMNEISKKENIITKYISSLNFIDILLFPIIKEILGNKKYIAKFNSTEKEKINLSYKQTKDLYTEIIKQVDKAIDLIFDILGKKLEKLN